MRAILAALAFSVLAFGARAHGGHDDRLKVFVQDTEVHVEIWIAAAQLAAFDRDGDGALSRREFDAQKRAISRWIDERLSVVCDDGERLTPVFADEPVEGHHLLDPDDAVHQLRIVRRYRFDNGQQPRAIAYSLFDDQGAPKPYAVWKNGQIATGILKPEKPMLLLR